MSALDILFSVSPSVAEITTLFGSFNRLSPAFRNAIFEAMDDKMLEKIGNWSSKFTDELNKLEVVDAQSVRKMLDPNLSGDFFEVMKGTKYQGVLLGTQELQVAQNIMAKAIKANNWKQAIEVGIALAGALPV